MEKSDLSNRTKAVASSIAANSIDRYMRSVFESAPTIYDKAMDAGRHVMKEYGPDHRLFDNLHSPLGAWSSVQDAVKDDSLRQEVAAFLRAYWKDDRK